MDFPVSLPGVKPRRVAPKIFKEKEKKLLAGRMAGERVLQGASVAELSEKYRVSENQVRKLLNYADQKGLLDHHRAQIFEDLLPKAIAVYEKHLESGNLEAARDVVHGLGVLNPKQTLELTRGEGEETLEIYRLRRKLALETDRAIERQGQQSSVVEGEIPVDAETVAQTPGESHRQSLLSEGFGVDRKRLEEIPGNRSEDQ